MKRNYLKPESIIIDANSTTLMISSCTCNNCQCSHNHDSGNGGNGNQAHCGCGNRPKTIAEPEGLDWPE